MSESNVSSQDTNNNTKIKSDTTQNFNPVSLLGKQILHTWDDGNNNLTEYDGKILAFNETTNTFTTFILVASPVFSL